MGWFEKLKDFIKVDLKLSPTLKINSPDIKIVHLDKADESNKEEFHYNEDSGTLIINLNNLPCEKLKQLKLMIKEYKDEGGRLLKDKTSDTLNDICTYEKSNSDKPILDFFKPIISKQDYDALEASLYLRDAFRRGMDTGKMKGDIRNTFGERGSNIANLCTAGYFETYLRPLYNSAPREQFDKLYELVVTNSVLAVFVHGQMTPQQIKSDIIDKLSASKKYGLRRVYVHGIGHNNAQKIKDCVTNHENELGFYAKRIYEERGVIAVELILK